MLDIALQFLKDQVDSYFRAQTSSDSEVVRLSKVVDESGKYAFEEDTICATVVNIEEERVFKSQLPEYTYINGQHIVLEPELKFNLFVMFAANFRLYDQALKHLSYVLTFFQSHPSFTPDAYAGLDPRIAKLTVELQSLNFEQLNQVWAFIGGKQLPSVIYKVHSIVIQDQTPQSVQPPLTTINANLRRQ